MANEAMPTRGPVEVASFRGQLRVQALDADRTYICAFEGPSGHPFVNREANAARIAACIDALAGLNPEAVKGVVEAAEYLVATDGMGLPQLEKALSKLKAVTP